MVPNKNWMKSKSLQPQEIKIKPEEIYTLKFYTSH